MHIHKIHMAPMMGWTDRHFRYLLRRICPSVLLYTEMITTGSLIYGERFKQLEHDVSEYPLLVQFGGSDPDDLYRCCELATEYGYSGVNLNIGCPSARVQAGNMGAALYKDRSLIVRCVEAMARSGLPVSVKLRIGVDDCDELSYLIDVVRSVRNSGCAYVQIHARKAWLNGLNPRQNRSVPPLNYDRVRELKDALGDFPVILNGGLVTLDACVEHLAHFQGVMIGRKACEDPWFLRDLHEHVENRDTLMSKDKILVDYMQYFAIQLDKGSMPSKLVKPLVTIMKGFPKAKKMRTKLIEWSRLSPDQMGLNIQEIQDELLEVVTT